MRHVPDLWSIPLTPLEKKVPMCKDFCLVCSLIHSNAYNDAGSVGTQIP